MAKLYCKKENKYFFGTFYCPDNKIKKCKEISCEQQRLSNSRYLEKQFAKLFKKYMEPLAYKFAYHHGVILWITKQAYMDEKSLDNTRRLWSLPEPLGHAVHQEYIALEKKCWWWKLPFFRRDFKNRRQRVFSNLISKYEKIAEKKYKNYKPYVWPNKKLMAELKKGGYTGENLYGK